jgi:glycosyltransferase involved in cell wall biosynthesis
MSSEPSAVVWRPGDGDTLRDAADAAGRADLVVLMPGVQPFGDWLARLTAAAHAQASIASASAMLSGGPLAPAPLAADGDLERLADDVAGCSGRLRPRIAAPVAGCVLLRRSALDLAAIADGHVSAAFALADFGERCTALGLGHVLADDVLAAGEPAALEPAEEAALAERYPHRRAARELDARPESPVEHALLVASRGLDKLSVTIDARALGPARAGTQVHALELVAALGRTGRVALRVVTPPDLDPQARAALEQIDDLALLPYENAAREPRPPTDIVHRPSQVFSVDDLALLLPLGKRIVVTHQDLIAYRIAGYHATSEEWLRYRRVTRDTLAAADHVVFFSEHARADALADELVGQATASVVPIGVDHRVTSSGDGAEPRRPPALPRDERPFLLCLGADLRHKNHGFALALAAALRAEHGWDGRLVFAGPAGSAGAEVAGDEATVTRLGPVAEDEKAWLLAHAAAVVYPTLYEGFGLIPFEAGAAGTPCLFAAWTSLAEVLPASAATLVPWDARASAAATAALLHDGPQRDAHVATLRDAATGYRWDDTARALVALYEAVLVAPPSDLRRAPRERLELERRLAETEFERQQEWQRHLAFREQIGSDGLGLVGPGGVLEPADQRALLALLSRAGVRRPAMRAARAAYGLAGKLRRHG